MLLEKCENIGYFNNVLVGCGKCPNCRNQKRNEWSIRLEHELIMNGNKGAFVTLTYNNENLLITGATPICEGDEMGTLNKKDTQDFMKRLRKKLGKEKKIKYILAGEYGTAFKRPHYHIIFLGIDWKDCEELELEKVWGKGKVDIDRRPIGPGAINYIYNYIKKDSFKTKADKLEFELKYNRVAEFITQSQGIGKNWALENVAGWSQSMEINYNGHKCNIPRYYIKMVKKIEGRTIKKKRTIINHYKNGIEKRTYTYYKVIENPAGKFTKLINEKCREKIIETIKKIKEDKRTEYNFEFMLKEYDRNEEIKKYIYKLDEKIIKKGMLNYKNKLVLKPKNWEKIKERNERSIREKFGDNLNFYLMQSKSKNDIIRQKIEATKRNYDVTEKKEYILRKKLKKTLDNSKKQDIIDNEKRMINAVQEIFGECEVTYSHEKNIAEYEIGAIKRTDYWEPNPELEFLLEKEREEKKYEKEWEYALYMEWKGRKRSGRNI